MEYFIAKGGLHLCKRMEDRKLMVLKMCWHFPVLHTHIQQLESGLHLYEQREAHGLTDKLLSTRYTRSVSSKVVLSRQRHWREEQLEYLRRRAKAELVRSPGGRYDEELDSVGVACFSLIGGPILLADAFNSR